MPDWISEIKTRKEQSIAERDAEEARAALASKMLAVDAPKFWSALTTELGAMVARLHEIGVRATISDLSTNIEKGCQIAVSATSSMYPRQIHTNVFYGNGSNRIRCIPLDSAPYDLSFQIVHDHLSVIASNSHSLLTPNDAATLILEPMVARLGQL